jgi:hypothetical protein
MHERAIRRAAILAMAATVLTASAAVADTLPADGDELTPGVQDFLEVGPVVAGGSMTVPIWFDLVCNTNSHVDSGQSISLSLSSQSEAPEGGSVTADDMTLGPIPAAWPDDGSGCNGTASLHFATPAQVTLTAPGAAGSYEYIVEWDRTLTPAGSTDGAAILGPTRVFFEMAVTGNTAPELTVPADMNVEGNATGGATVTFAATAVDAEDDPDPTPVCTPVSGSLFALGATTVDCTVTDAGGLEDDGSFVVTVVDTTAPVLAGVPSSVSQTTTSPSGTTAAYALPTATDVVDPAPSVDCVPAPGDAVPVGTTNVVCTAADASGNTATAGFPLTVTFDPPPPPPADLHARFGTPIGADELVKGKSGRVVPVKAWVYRGRSLVTQGRVDVVLATCAGAPLDRTLVLRRHHRRWQANLDTTGLAGCVEGTLRLDGQYVGSFELRLEPPKPPNPPKPPKPPKR